MPAASATKRLSEILDWLSIPAELDVCVSGICSDSRTVRSGEMFVAYPGHDHDGRHFIDQAIERGAAVILVEQSERSEQRSEMIRRGATVLIPLQGVQHALSQLAANFYDNPGESMLVVGVTGTNGKTSCTHYLAQLWEKLGEKSGVIGTLGYGSGHFGALHSVSHTTPDPLQLQRMLNDLLSQGIDHVAMEVSSHGLAQRRAAAVGFDAALFTNLSHDHLDYHGSMAAYGESKQLLFEMPGLRYAVLNSDDAFGRQLQKQIPQTVQTVTYSTRQMNADIRVREAEFSRHGFRADICTPWGDAALSAPLIGEFNLSNVLGVIGVLCSLGHPLEQVAACCTQLNAVPGRMESVDNDFGVSVIIDYAHTPDALQNVLKAVREHCAGQLWCVLGCGGDRDKAKRPVMGRIAAQLADFVIITNDNPRTEVPEHIVEQIRAGCRVGNVSDLPGQQIRIELDRAAAIFSAISHAAPGDCVLVAGKGHEEYQDIGGEKLPFSDRFAIQQAFHSITENTNTEQRLDGGLL